MKHKNNKTKIKYKPKYGGMNPGGALPIATQIAPQIASPLPMDTGESGPVKVELPKPSILKKIVDFISTIRGIIIMIIILISFFILLLICYIANKLFTAIFAGVNIIIAGINGIVGIFMKLLKLLKVRTKYKPIVPMPKTLYDLALKSIPPLPPLFGKPTRTSNANIASLASAAKSSEQSRVSFDL